MKCRADKIALQLQLPQKTNSNPPPSRALLLRFPSEAAASPTRIFQRFPSHRAPSRSRSTASQHRCLPAECIGGQTEPPCTSLAGSQGQRRARRHTATAAPSAPSAPHEAAAAFPGCCTAEPRTQRPCLRAASCQDLYFTGCNAFGKFPLKYIFARNSLLFLKKRLTH